MHGWVSDREREKSGYGNGWERNNFFSSLLVNAWKQIVAYEIKKKFVMVQIWLIVDRDVLCWNECQFSTFRKIQIILTENFLITHYTALNLIWVICKATKKSVKLPLGCVRTKRQQTLRLCVQQQNSGFSLISWKIVSERTHPICTLNELRSLLHEPDCLGDYQSKQCRV